LGIAIAIESRRRLVDFPSHWPIDADVGDGQQAELARMMKRPDKQFVVPSPRAEPHYIVPLETIDDAWLTLLTALDRLRAALSARLKP
jgi:hypothetical protein